MGYTRWWQRDDIDPIRFHTKYVGPAPDLLYFTYYLFKIHQDLEEMYFHTSVAVASSQRP